MLLVLSSVALVSENSTVSCLCFPCSSTSTEKPRPVNNSVAGSVKSSASSDGIVIGPCDCISARSTAWRLGSGLIDGAAVGAGGAFLGYGTVPSSTTGAALGLCETGAVASAPALLLGRGADALALGRGLPEAAVIPGLPEGCAVEAAAAKPPKSEPRNPGRLAVVAAGAAVADADGEGAAVAGAGLCPDPDFLRAPWAEAFTGAPEAAGATPGAGVGAAEGWLKTIATS
jgi:hypothetical protein